VAYTMLRRATARSRTADPLTSADDVSSRLSLVVLVVLDVRLTWEGTGEYSDGSGD
jgi:hypothetical protein